MCSKIIENAKEKEHEKLKQQAVLLKGKAAFYGYQRKIFYLMEKKQVLLRADERKLIGDCFKSIEEAVNLLGFALDNLYIDEEGSMLLDWAMMDCIRETNCLNLCKRCLLCRRMVSLCKSHIFPKFVLKSAPVLKLASDKGEALKGKKAQQEDSSKKVFTFGLDKYQMKSAGECWLWLCCSRCEEIMTQNAENDFSLLFPSSGTVEYTSWLFNYCCTILFRTISCVKFPRTFNDEEVYGALLFCRKHLLSLPVKTKAPYVPSDSEEYQSQLLSRTASKDLEPYLITTPPTVVFEREGGVLEDITLHFTIPWLANHRLVDGRLDSAGWSHFFVAYFNGVSILLRFRPSLQCSLPSDCLVSPQEGTYTVPEESEAIKLIPRGLWMLYNRSAMKSSRDLTEMLQQVHPTAAKKMVSKGLPVLQLPPAGLGAADMDSYLDSVVNSGKSVGDSSTIQFQSSGYKPRLNLLPPGFNIIPSPSPTALSPLSKSIDLPQGHQIVLHHVEESHGLSVFLAVGNSGRFLPHQPYVIYILDKGDRTYVDGSFITTVNGEVCFSQFLLDHSLSDPLRASNVQESACVLVENMLAASSFLTLELFMQYLKCRQSHRAASHLPSIGKKCSAKGCWYCRDLCHYCMTKVSVSSEGQSEPADHRYCSKICMKMFTDSTALPQSMFVIDHREELFNGKFKGPSVLDIVKVHREEGAEHNTIELINLCLGNGSEGLPQGEPYVLWQVRSIDSQYCFGFHITNKCTPIGLLLFDLGKDRETALLEGVMGLKPELSYILDKSMSALKCGSVAEYLEIFLNQLAT